MSSEAYNNAEDAASYLEDLQEFASTDGRQKFGATWSLGEACESGKIRLPNVQDDDGYPLGLEDIDKKTGHGCISMLFSLGNHGFDFNPLCLYWNTDNMGGKESPKVRLALVLQIPVLDNFKQVWKPALRGRMQRSLWGIEGKRNLSCGQLVRWNSCFRGDRQSP